MTKHIDITGALGTPMRVLLIPAGEPYPNHPGVEPAKEDLVEFYDGRYPHTPDGQFISRYYSSTLLNSHTGVPTGGLDLMGYEPAWKIDGRTMKLVLDWVSYHQYLKP
jgi:hypothetical protein